MSCTSSSKCRRRGAGYREFRNTGTAFEDVTPDNIRALQADHGVVWFDVDGDGDEDLGLTGARADGMHHLMRNLVPAADARRSLRVRVLDARHRATVAGAEVRVYGAGTRRLIGARIVESGSGYDGQNVLPLHFGLGRSDASMSRWYSRAPVSASSPPFATSGPRNRAPSP